MPTILAERQRLYDEAMTSAALLSPVRMIQIILRPILIIRDNNGSHPHPAFVSQMLRFRLGRTIRLATSGAVGIVDDVIRKLHSHAPGLSLALFEFRRRTGALAFGETGIIIEMGLEHCAQQRRAIGEVAIKGADAHACALGHGVQCNIWPAQMEQIGGRVDQELAVLCRVSSHRCPALLPKLITLFAHAITHQKA